MKNILLLIAAFPCMIWSQGFLLNGVIFEELAGIRQPAPGATVMVLPGGSGTLTDAFGKFELQVPGGTWSLVVSYPGYYRDTILGDPETDKISFTLTRPVKTEEVQITARQNTLLQTLDPIKTDILTEKELTKAPCCSLGESFGTSATVDMSYKDGVTGSKEISLLGLAGKYALLLSERMPVVRGLNINTGMDLIPGPWLSFIYVIKGTGCAANGAESMTGHINLEYRKPDSTFNHFLSLYGSHQGRAEFNSFHSIPLSHRLQTGFLTHYSRFLMQQDQNGDGFMDQPVYQKLHVLNRWHYTAPSGFSARVFGAIFTDTKEGGQLEKREQPGQPLYQTKLSLFRTEGQFALEWKDPACGLSPFQVFGSAYRHEQTFTARMQQWKAGETYGKFLGLYTSEEVGGFQFSISPSFQFSDLKEHLGDSTFSRMEFLPGIAGELTWKPEERPWTIVSAARVDYHSMFGWQFTPRLHLKYDAGRNLIFRISGGRGSRTPFLMAENVQLLVSSRRIMGISKPGQEISWSSGGGFYKSWTYGIMANELSLSVDYFLTYFERMLLPDWDMSSAYVAFYPVQGALSHTVQADFMIQAGSGFDFRMSYKFQKTQAPYRNGVQELAYVPRHRLLFNSAWENGVGNLKTDLTLSWTGPQRLPAMPDSIWLEHRTYSPGFLNINAQVTRTWNGIDFYAGGENLLNVRQRQLIISPENPFSSTFDATRIWGPSMGMNLYAGIRIRLHQQPKL